MNLKDELIYEIKYSLPSRRMLDVVALGVVELYGELIVIKTRYGNETTKRIVGERGKDFIRVKTPNKDMNHDYSELMGRHVIYDRSVLGRRGLVALIALAEIDKPVLEPVTGIKGFPRELSSCFLQDTFEGLKKGELIQLNSYSRAGISYMKIDHPDIDSDLDVDKHKK